MSREEITETRRWEENPHSDPRIAFIICYPFQYYVYKNIYRYLDDAEFIVDFGVFFPTRQSRELENDLIVFLQRVGVHYRILYYSDYFFKEYSRRFFEPYKTLVGVWERGCLLLSCNKDKKKVSVTYGAGKELTQVRFSRRYNDLILAFGSRDVKLFSLFTEAKIVGNPKFDDWFNGEFDQVLLLQVGERLSNRKKTILYLPTHGDLSSLEALSDKLCELTDTYNVIAKIHYFLLRENDEQVNRLRGKGIVVLGDDADLLPLLKLCDVVLSDNSSAIFDAILADKPLVVTDFLSKEYLDIQHKKLKRWKRATETALTYSGSIEQLVKRDGSVVVMRSPEEACGSVEKALCDSISYRQARKRIREELFAFHDGRCGLRAAEAIRSLTASRKKAVERTILSHAVEAYVAGLGRQSLFNSWSQERLIDGLEEVVFGTESKEFEEKGIFFSVIILDDGDDGFGFSLRALYDQRFPEGRYEVLVVSRRRVSDLHTMIEHSGLSHEQQNRTRCFLVQSDEYMSQSVLRAIKDSRGVYICFTRSGYRVSNRWLEYFFLAYKQTPDLAGVGGYANQMSGKDESRLNEFDYTEIGRQLGTIRNRDFFREMQSNVSYRNPAGTFCNMSYEKSILLDRQDVFQRKSFDLIEIELKVLVAYEKKDVRFIPQPVHRIDPLTWKKFARKNFLLGEDIWVLCYLYPRIGRYYRVTFMACVRAFLSNMIDNQPRKRFIVGLIVFSGYLFRWFGYLSMNFQSILLLGDRLRNIHGSKSGT